MIISECHVTWKLFHEVTFAACVLQIRKACLAFWMCIIKIRHVFSLSEAPVPVVSATTSVLAVLVSVLSSHSCMAKDEIYRSRRQHWDLKSAQISSSDIDWQIIRHSERSIRYLDTASAFFWESFVRVATSSDPHQSYVMTQSGGNGTQ